VNAELHAVKEEKVVDKYVKRAARREKSGEIGY
jgi:hypothetical protein